MVFGVCRRKPLIVSIFNPPQPCYGNRKWTMPSKILCLLFLINGSLFIHLAAFQPSNPWKKHSNGKGRRKLYATPQVENVHDAKHIHLKENNDRFLTPEQNDFFNSMSTEVYGGPFIERIRDLQEYKNKFGTCHVPKRYAENPKLGNWVNKSRQMYRKHVEGEKTSMTPERIQILNKIGFVWLGTNAHNTNSGWNFNEVDGRPLSYQQSREKIWNDNFHQLQEYIEANQSTIPSKSKLGIWAARQRREYTKLNLGEKAGITQERVDLLNSVGFDWSPWDTKWQLRVNELLEYKREHGDCLVPVQYKKNEQLGRWVSTQRKYHKLYNEGKPTRITEERIKQLCDIGFVWNRWEHVWNTDE